jgi:EpsI family protein
MTRESFQWWIPMAAVAVLGSMEAWKMTLPDASAGAPFLAEVKKEFANFPPKVGDWEGTDFPIPQEAVALLHPNLFISRQYINRATQQTVQLLFIEAEDSRDMMGHYPPNCYPGNGWELTKQEPGTWKVDDLVIPGNEYTFKRESAGREQHLMVRDFFILPDGRFYPDLSSFARAASSFYIRSYGATQVQVIFDRDYLPEDRDEIFNSLIIAHKPLIHAVMNGKKS